MFIFTAGTFLLEQSPSLPSGNRHHWKPIETSLRAACPCLVHEATKPVRCYSKRAVRKQSLLGHDAVHKDDNTGVLLLS